MPGRGCAYAQAMSDVRIPLHGDRARAFREEFDKRDAYIHAEGIHHLIGGEDRVPLPGCPECSAPAEAVGWAVYDEPDERIEVDVDPCGHRFRVARPIMVRSSGEGWWSEDEWLP